MLARTAKQHVSALSWKALTPQARTSRLATSADTPANLPLSGVRVLELGQLIAGPFAGQLLGHFGAEVIKVEPPNTGDPLRVWRELDVDGTSPWFRSLGRNKKSVTIDLRKDEGRALVKKLALESDVVLENFKPGTLEKWGLGPADLQPLNPSLIFTRVSGYGQTGPWAKRPGYASVCEAESGFRYINGFPDPATGGLAGPPVRPNLSLGDSVAGLHAAFGTVLALLARRVKQDNGLAGGSTVDRLMAIPAPGPKPVRLFSHRHRATNAYPCLPSPATPTTPTPSGGPDLIGADYKQNPERVARQAEIEQAIGAWTSARSAEEVLETLNEIGVPVGRVVSVREIVEGEQVKARGLVEDVWVPAGASMKKKEAVGEGKEIEEDGWMVKMPKVAPLLEGCDACTRWAGPDLGQHNEEVFMGQLGLSDEEMKNLVERGIIGGR
ncbi:hypothetical protein EVG20_g6124 [Dentipellis fragilis]|uniref:CoA-transferase family III n=1 Tax=Dentipellis fragilis TaxID=205917 RepID=A0A4Y9YS82_9AGAM|nr:hypothetical protein EVG20_g6124 [Dentipellis fragilis]